MARLDKGETVETPPASFGSNSGADRELFSFVERLERLAEEKAALTEDTKEVMGEAKGRGFDTKTIRKVMSLRKMDAGTRAECEALLDTYWTAIERAEKAQFAQSQADGA